MQIETEIQVEYVDTLGDNIPEDTTEEEIKELINLHIEAYCAEHSLSRNCVKIIKSVRD